MLSNVNIREAIAAGQLAIENLQDKAIQPASIDLHLGNQFIAISKMANWESVQLDPYDEEMTNLAFGPMLELPHYLLLPGRFVLAATERVTLGNQLVAQVAGKSSLARDCLVVENAGYIDPGFDGPITMELFNQGPFTLVLTAGMPIAQLAVTRLDSPANPVYSGKYLGASGPQVSMYWKNKRPGAGA